ncbi:MAG: hypothetical protein ABSE67_21220 [Xanthobacteraceae bacterium]
MQGPLGGIGAVVDQEVPKYSFYRVDKYGRSWGLPEIVECKNDEVAVSHAKRILTGYAIEVRQSDRVLMRIEPEVSALAPK